VSFFLSNLLAKPLIITLAGWLSRRWGTAAGG